MNHRLFLCIAGILAASAFAANPIRVLIIDGQNNHNWVDTTPFLKAQMPAMKCVGFLATVKRSCEWAATGKVTTAIPKDFPKPDTISLTK